MKVINEPPKDYRLGEYKAWKKDPRVKKQISLWKNPGIYLVAAIVIGFIIYFYIVGGIFVDRMNAP